MRIAYSAVLAMTVLLLVTAGGVAQEPEVTRTVAGGGISVDGWQGKIDANEASKGLTLNDAKFFEEGDAMHFITGPAVTYWNPANTASGNYTVKATFREPQYMNLNDHPHPYGVVIAGNDMGTDQMTLLYCSAYGNGTFIVRGFGPAPFRMSDNRPTASPAVNKASGNGQPVTQEIALSVKGDKIECAVNGTVVGSYNKADAVATGKLKSTDGVYGLRFGHNTEGLVTNLTVTKN
jgi:hypothetical protein